jgi:hypothetical protein
MPIAVFEDNITKLAEAHRECGAALRDLASAEDRAAELRDEDAAANGKGAHASHRASSPGHSPGNSGRLSGRLSGGLSGGGLSGGSLGLMRSATNSAKSMLSSPRGAASQLASMIDSALGHPRIDEFRIRAVVEQGIAEARYVALPAEPAPAPEVSEGGGDSKHRRGAEEANLRVDASFAAAAQANEAIASLDAKKLLSTCERRPSPPRLAIASRLRESGPSCSRRNLHVCSRPSLPGVSRAPPLSYSLTPLRPYSLTYLLSYRRPG